MAEITPELDERLAQFLRGDYAQSILDQLRPDLDTNCKLTSVESFTSSGTWTKADWPNLSHVVVHCIGGGGGGAGAGSNSRAGGGGGGGAYAQTVVQAKNLNATETVTVGSGGAGGAAGNNSGSSGSDTSFGAHCVADAATGGTHPGVGGEPGVGGTVAGSTGDILVGGQGGGGGSNSNVAPGPQGGSAGGHYGGGGGKGAAITGTARSGGDGEAPGGGGGGAHRVSANGAGGDGADGACYVEVYEVEEATQAPTAYELPPLPKVVVADSSFTHSARTTDGDFGNSTTGETFPYPTIQYPSFTVALAPADAVGWDLALTLRDTSGGGGSSYCGVGIRNPGTNGRRPMTASMGSGRSVAAGVDPTWYLYGDFFTATPTSGASIGYGSHPSYLHILVVPDV